MSFPYHAVNKAVRTGCMASLTPIPTGGPGPDPPVSYPASGPCIIVSQFPGSSQSERSDMLIFVAALSRVNLGFRNFWFDVRYHCT